jgi:hypothetical protein
MSKPNDFGARAAGIAWIRETDYQAVVAIFEDGHTFDRDWKAWERRALAAEQDLKARGIVVERVYLDPDTFASWCLANGYSTGRDGRVAYGAEMAHQKYGRNQS